MTEIKDGLNSYVPTKEEIKNLEYVVHNRLDFIGLETHYYADSKCTGCGICEKVCLSKKIKLINKKPVWQNNVKCFNCYACINYCPMQSAQIKSFTEKNGRYSHPYATSDDIARQKYFISIY